MLKQQALLVAGLLVVAAAAFAGLGAAQTVVVTTTTTTTAINGSTSGAANQTSTVAPNTTTVDNTNATTANATTISTSTTTPVHVSTTTPTTKETTNGPPVLFTTSFNQTVSYWFLPPALPGLALNFVGYRYVGVSMFVVGAAVSGGAFYTFSPQIFPNTPFCCGDKGSLAGHIIVSLFVGLLGGLIALYVFRLGLFFIGMSFGLMIALGLHLTPLRNESWLQSEGEVIAFYTVLMLVGGISSLIFRKLFVILTTSIGGSLLFMLGVEYFVRSGFGSLVLYCLGQIVEAIRGDLTHGNGRVKFDRSFNSEAYIMVASWLVLTVIGIAVQFATGTREDSKTQQKVFIINDADPPRHGRYRILRMSGSGRSTSSA